MENSKYLTLKELSELADTPYATIKRDIDCGTLPAYKVGRKYFIAADEGAQYVAKKQELHQIEGYSIRQIMEILPLSYAFIIDLIKSGRLPAVKVGRRYIVPTADFENFIQQMKFNS